MMRLRPIFLSLSFVLTTPSLGAAAVTCSNVFAQSADESLTAETTSTRVPLRYYIDKLREIPHLDRSAPLAVSLRAMIMSMSKEVRLEQVRLGDLREIHPITRPVASDKTSERTANLQKMPRHTFRDGALSGDVLNAYLPSKNPIRVVHFREENSYIVFDGNGRLIALRAAFDPSVLVTVEHFVSDSPLLQWNLRKLLQIRGLNEDLNLDSEAAAFFDRP